MALESKLKRHTARVAVIGPRSTAEAVRGRLRADAKDFAPAPLTEDELAGAAAHGARDAVESGCRQAFDSLQTK